MAKKKIISLLFGLAVIVIFLYLIQMQWELSFPESSHEFEIQGLTWRTVPYYQPGIYSDLYSFENNVRLLRKAKEVGADYLLLRVLFNGTKDGKVVGNNAKAKQYLKKAILQAHNQGFKILLVPYVESRDYWVLKKWVLSEEVWTDVVLEWAAFAEENNVEMFAPGVEMNLIMDEDKAGEWLKKILLGIRQVYHGKVITAEHYDINRWKALDRHESFTGYDCIGLTLFPRKEYNGVSDIRSIEDYKEYVEMEARVIDMLSEKYDINCKLAVPMGLDYWKGSYPKNPNPSAEAVANATNIGLTILKNHDFTGVFISHWASEPDHFGNSQEVEAMLKKRWTKVK